MNIQMIIVNQIHLVLYVKTNIKKINLFGYLSMEMLMIN